MLDCLGPGAIKAKELEIVNVSCCIFQEFQPWIGANLWFIAPGVCQSGVDIPHYLRILSAVRKNGLPIVNVW